MLCDVSGNHLLTKDVDFSFRIHAFIAKIYDCLKQTDILALALIPFVKINKRLPGVISWQAILALYYMSPREAEKDEHTKASPLINNSAIWNIVTLYEAKTRTSCVRPLQLRRVVCTLRPSPLPPLPFLVPSALPSLPTALSVNPDNRHRWWLLYFIGF